MDPAGIDALQEAILYTHGVESTWVESVPVTETFNGETVWDGEVQVFDLLGHPQAQRAYVWSYTQRTKRSVLAVLHLGPIVDAITAVRASIAASQT